MFFNKLFALFLFLFSLACNACVPPANTTRVVAEVHGIVVHTAPVADEVPAFAHSLRYLSATGEQLDTCVLHNHSHNHQVDMRFLWKQWQTQFNVTDVDDVRFDTFVANHDMIVTHNSAPNETWTMAHNAFSHLNQSEFKARYLTLQPRSRLSAQLFNVAPNDAPAESSSIDWTTRGAVTPVKNQEQCGSCWAFSTTGSLEGALFLKTGKLQSLSEQMLVDCDTTDSGCNGGLMDNAFAWIAQNGGICAEAGYPYTAQTGTCHNSCTVVPGITGQLSHVDVAANDAALTTAIQQQPVSIAIEADQSGFQFYSSGVFSGTCGTNLDHGVLAVGYGPAANGLPAYYKVKNSWGPEWGSKGYILIQKGAKQSGGLCGILTSASFPVLH